MAEYNDMNTTTVEPKKSHKHKSKKHKKHKSKHDSDNEHTTIQHTELNTTNTTNTLISTCMYTTQLTIHIHLFPNKLHNIQQSVIEYMNQYILQYNTDIDAILLAYNNIHYNTQYATILYDRPHCNFTVQCSALLFKPVVGDIIQCRVNKITNDYISCLLYNIFNITIVYNNIPPSYIYDEYNNKYTYNEHSINVDTMLQVHIIDIQHTNNILAIDASLRFAHTGIVVDSNVIELNDTQLTEPCTTQHTIQHKPPTTQLYDSNDTNEHLQNTAKSAALQSHHTQFFGDTVHQQPNQYNAVQNNQVINNIQTQHTKRTLDSDKPLSKKQQAKQEKLLAKEQRRQEYLAKAQQQQNNTITRSVVENTADSD